MNHKKLQFTQTSGRFASSGSKLRKALVAFLFTVIATTAALAQNTYYVDGSLALPEDGFKLVLSFDTAINKQKFCENLCAPILNFESEILKSCNNNIYTII